MYFKISDNIDHFLCEVGIYAEKAYPGELWFIKMYVSFNIMNYSNFLIHNSSKAYEIAKDFKQIQEFVLDLNEHTGIYPEVKLYDLQDKGLTEDKAEITKITRDRLYIIANKYDLRISED